MNCLRSNSRKRFVQGLNWTKWIARGSKIDFLHKISIETMEETSIPLIQNVSKKTERRTKSAYYTKS